MQPVHKLRYAFKRFLRAKHWDDEVWMRRYVGLNALKIACADDLMREKGYPSVLSPGLRAALKTIEIYARGKR